MIATQFDDKSPSARVLDPAELDAVAGGMAAVNWALGGARIGAKHGALFGPGGTLFGAAVGAGYFTYYYFAHK